MQKIMMICAILLLVGCSMGGSIGVGGGSNGVGISLGTGIRF